MPVERRTPKDLALAVAVTVVMTAAAVTVFALGSASRSEFATAGDRQPVYGPATEAPTELEYLWSHASQGQGAPLTTKGNLVTVDPSGTLVGRDAGSGEQRWSYSNPGRLCAATFYSDVVVAAYDGAAGCSDVTAVNTTDQHYASTRQSAFPDMMELTSTWRHALALSPERLEIWRDDVVRTVEYGNVTAPQEPGMQPRTGCTLGTAALTDERFAVAERCPGDDSVRLTVSGTVPEDSRKPEEVFSDVTGADDLWILGMTDDEVLALARRGERWAVEWFTSPSGYRAVLPLPGSPVLPPSFDSVSGDDRQLRWFDGAATHAFDLDTGDLAWTVTGTTGPGLTGGWSPDPDDRTARDWVLLPAPGRMIVTDHGSGAEIRALVTGGDDDDEVGITDAAGVTGLAQIGDILYERRAGEVLAFKMKA